MPPKTYTKLIELPTEDLIRYKTAYKGRLKRANKVLSDIHRRYSEAQCEVNALRDIYHKIDRELAERTRLSILPPCGEPRRPKAAPAQPKQPTVAQLAKMLKGMTMDEVNALLEKSKKEAS